MKQMARNLTDVDDGFLKRTRYLIHDRDPLFTERFREILKPSGVKTVKLPARSPDLNAYAERFVHSVKSECLAKIIPLGEHHLRKAVKEYTEHYHLERNHQVLPLHGNTVQSEEVHQQGLDNELIEKLTDSPSMDAAAGGPGKLPSQGSHRSGRARLTHPAPRSTGSLHELATDGRFAEAEAGSVSESAQTCPTGLASADLCGRATCATYVSSLARSC